MCFMFNGWLRVLTGTLCSGEAGEWLRRYKGECGAVHNADERMPARWTAGACHAHLSDHGD